MTERSLIQEFLQGKRIALVGVSSHPEDFSRFMMRELLRCGYDVIPVHPGIEEIEGRKAFARVQDIPEPVDGALVMTNPEVSKQIAQDCVEAGIRRIWLHKGLGGAGAVSKEAVSFCQEQQLDVVAGQCPLMFLEKPAWFHRAHAALKKIAHTYPPA